MNLLLSRSISSESSSRPFVVSLSFSLSVHSRVHPSKLKTVHSPAVLPTANIELRSPGKIFMQVIGLPSETLISRSSRSAQLRLLVLRLRTEMTPRRPAESSVLPELSNLQVSGLSCSFHEKPRETFRHSRLNEALRDPAVRYAGVLLEFEVRLCADLHGVEVDLAATVVVAVAWVSRRHLGSGCAGRSRSLWL